ncbi:hypothetical protein LAUMK191_05640 [Mycobacterium attenuatum]|nr:hypothetical protein LAUMK191_05640 [Mycobacterium attenuatum]
MPTCLSASPPSAGPASALPLMIKPVTALAAAASAVVSASRTASAPCSGRTAADIAESAAARARTHPTGAPLKTATMVAAIVRARTPIPIARCS